MISRRSGRTLREVTNCNAREGGNWLVGFAQYIIALETLSNRNNVWTGLETLSNRRRGRACPCPYHAGAAVKEVESVTSAQTPTVLAIDTSANDSSVAIRKGERYLAALAVGEIHHHSQSLFEHLELILQLSNVRIEEIDVFAAVSGPGSFTGLRVGLSAIKGIAGTLGRPVVGVTAFDALAASLGVKGNVAAMIDAGRGEVYLGLRRIESDGLIAAMGRDVSGPLNMALEQCLAHFQVERRPLFLVGSGAVRYSQQISHIVEDAGIESRRPGRNTSDTIDPEFTGWSILERYDFLAGSVAAVAARRLRPGQTSPLKAYYLKPSDAELKWIERSIPKTR